MRSTFFKRRNAAIGIALAAGLLLGTAGAGLAGGTGTPANKATAAGSKRVILGPNAKVRILSATMKTSKPTDLILQLTLECSIFTRLKTASTAEGGSSTAAATGTVKAWITIDGAVVPVESVSAPPQNPPPAGVAPVPGQDTPSDAATMCNRAYQRTVTDAEDPQDGQDTEEDFIRTKSANGFNWLRQNTGSGMHVIEVWAELDQRVVGDATAEAQIGNRTLIIEPTKMANDAVIAENGSS